MSTALANPAVPAQPELRRWNTLQLLWIHLGGLLAVAALLLIAIVMAARLHSAAMKAVGKDTAPSIVAAQRIRTALADMDAQVAAGLLTSSAEAAAAYERRRVEAAEQLIAAAENITFGEAERGPIKRLELAMGRYEALVQRARDLRERGDKGFILAYRDAARVMDTELLPASVELDRANTDELNKQYQGRRATMREAETAIFLIGAGLIFLLLRLQFVLMVRTRRLLNPALLSATALVLIFGIYAITEMSRSRNELKVAREDAFVSVHALLQARAIAYAARASENRMLLDPDRALADQQDFMDKVSQLAHAVNQKDLGHLLGQAERRLSLSGYSGYFVDELKNVTFPGEFDAALDTLRNFLAFYDVDRKVWMELSQGHRDAAMALSAQFAPAFAKYDTALQKTLDINQKAFERSVSAGFEELAGLDTRAALAMAVVALLVYLGLMPRIREYR